MNAGKVYCEYPMIAFTMEKVQGILFVIDNANLLLNDEMWQQIDEKQGEIDAKQNEIDDLQKKLAD